MAQQLGSKAKPATAGEVQDFQARSSISAALRAGDLDQALAQTEQYAPGGLEANPRLLFRLRCQKFVELVRPVLSYPELGCLVNWQVSQAGTRNSSPCPHLPA